MSSKQVKPLSSSIEYLPFGIMKSYTRDRRWELVFCKLMYDQNKKDFHIAYKTDDIELSFCVTIDAKTGQEWCKVRLLGSNTRLKVDIADSWVMEDDEKKLPEIISIELERFDKMLTILQD